MTKISIRINQTPSLKVNGNNVATIILWNDSFIMRLLWRKEFINRLIYTHLFALYYI